MDSNIKEKLANRIISLREKRGLSQEVLASIAKIDRSYMSRIERAKVSTGIEKIAQIAKALDVEPWELLKFDE